MRDNIDLVIFGSQGDLAKRKLLPALYRLDKADLLPDNARIASVARHQISTNIYSESGARKSSTSDTKKRVG